MRQMKQTPKPLKFLGFCAFSPAQEVSSQISFHSLPPRELFIPDERNCRVFSLLLLDEQINTSRTIWGLLLNLPFRQKPLSFYTNICWEAEEIIAWHFYHYSPISKSVSPFSLFFWCGQNYFPIFTFKKSPGQWAQHCVWLSLLCRLSLMPIFLSKSFHA